MRNQRVFQALLLIPLFLAPISLPARFFLADRTFTVLPAQSSVQTRLAGKSWAYTVPFPVRNLKTIETLIQCESQGVNISRPDSNGLVSWGMLQFNGTSTWDEAERRFNFHGSPIIPADVIHLADMMISSGELGKSIR